MKSQAMENYVTPHWISLVERSMNVVYFDVRCREEILKARLSRRLADDERARAKLAVVEAIAVLGASVPSEVIQGGKQALAALGKARQVHSNQLSEVAIEIVELMERKLGPHGAGTLAHQNQIGLVAKLYPFPGTVNEFLPEGFNSLVQRAAEQKDLQLRVIEALRSMYNYSQACRWTGIVESPLSIKEATVNVLGLVWPQVLMAQRFGGKSSEVYADEFNRACQDGL